MPAVDVERDLRRLNLVMKSGDVEIVAIEGDVERPHRRRDLQLPVQTLGKPGAARADADEPGGFGDACAELPRELLAQRFSVWQVHPDNSAG